MTHKLPALLALLLLFLVPATVAAQNSTHIEVKDGKVYVNGDFVKELETSHGGVYFLNSDDDGAFGVLHGSGNTFMNADRVRERALKLSTEGLATFNNLDHRFFGSLQNRTMDTEIMRLEMRSRELAMKARQNPDEQADIEAELQTVLADIFDRKLELQEQRISELRNELQSLETRVQERSDSKSDVIDRRLQELLGRKDVLDW